MKTTTHILILIAIFLVSMVVEPAYAATPQKGKGKGKKKANPELTRAGNTFYIDGKDAIKGKQVLDFYAQHNCQAAYDQYKVGRQCYISGWALLGGGAGLTVIGLGCIIGGVVGTVEGAMDSFGGATQGGDGESGMRRMNSGASTVIAGGVLVGIGAVAQLVCIPLNIVGKKKMQLSAETYNASCRYTQARPQPYWSLQASNNGLGFAFNF